MTKPALVILAHADSEHVRRLLRVCQGHPIVLHCDSKTPRAVYDEMLLGLPSGVILAPRRDARLASWSLVSTELDCLALAVDQTDADHIVVISGSDYPLVDPSRFESLLAPFVNRSFLWNTPIPYRSWDVPGFRDGGLWRFRHYFPTRRDQIIWLGSKPLFNPIRRRVHPDLSPRASSHWKILARSDAVRTIDTVARRPDLVAFGRSMFTPEESFIASVLASASLWGSQALVPSEYQPSLANWPGHVSQHPDWFTPDDLPRIERLLREHGCMPGGPSDDFPNQGNPLFGRKFTSREGPLMLDQLEASLW